MIVLDLNGKWDLKSEDGTEIEATVPGSVFQNLLNAKKIEDPFFRENELDSRSVSEKDYWYSRKFAVGNSLLEMEKVYLRCDGIDTIAEIFLNKHLVMKCENMHRVWKTEIGKVLKEGENEITVHFTSPYKYTEVIKKENPDMDLEGHLFQAHLQMRKAAYMFGWDWGPALADMGIWKPIGIYGYNTGRLENLSIDQVHGFEKVELKCRIDSQIFHTGEAVSYKVSVFDPDHQLLEEKMVKIPEADLTICNPRLWWCNGYGEQPLYTVKVQMLSETGEILDEKKKRIGLRTLELCQEKDQWGRTFYFRINGVEVFAKGADYIPEDSFPARVPLEKTRKLLKGCIKANFNMIRVWGGGIYPSEFFLDCCDEMGLMIWQDFMFANIVSLWKGKDKENMAEEIKEQTKRLKDHACIALLCGNNETEMMIWDDMNIKYKQMYIQQYEEDMPKIVKEIAPDMNYWPSSPSAFGKMKDVENENYGDSHDWRVWHGELPFTHYRSTYPRFNSEFGLQSFPCMKTIESFTLPEDRNIFSYVMENHQKSKNGNRVINSYISQYFRFPKDFRALIYLSQMIQLEGIRYGVEHWRRNRNDRHCMGTLFWQLNDCWPVASWASVDCFGRWKGLQYGAKRFYEPVLVSACEEGKNVDLYISNETLESVCGVLKWKLFHVKKGLIKEDAISCHVRRLYTHKAVHLEFDSELKTRQDEREYYLYYSFESEEKKIGEGTVLFTKAKHFEFIQPQIKCEKLDERSWKLSSDQFAKFVEVDLGADVLLSDNYFDLVPGEIKFITVEETIRTEENNSADSAKEEKIPQIYTLYDSFEHL